MFSVGVGKTGVNAIVPFRASALAGNDALPGVKGEMSEVSAVVTDRLRIFRLEDDMFFRRKPPTPADRPRKRAGDAGIGSSPSCVAVLVRAGVAGDSLCIESPDGREVNGVKGGTWVTWDIGSGGEPSALVTRDCNDSAEIANSSSTEGTCVLIARLLFVTDTEEDREWVSIFSCLVFCPERRRSLTPALGEVPEPGGRGGGSEGAGGRESGVAEVGGIGSAPTGGGCGGGRSF